MRLACADLLWRATDFADCFLLTTSSVSLQRYFYPPMFRSQRKTDLSAVPVRVHEQFAFNLIMEGSTTWRIPTQEPSKDWRFPKEGMPDVQVTNAPKTTGRPYGWLDIKCSEGSQVLWTLPLMNDDHGYVSKVSVCFKDIVLTTSVNYAVFISAPQLKVKLLRFTRFSHRTNVIPFSPDRRINARASAMERFSPLEHRPAVSRLGYLAPS